MLVWYSTKANWVYHDAEVSTVNPRGLELAIWKHTVQLWIHQRKRAAPISAWCFIHKLIPGKIWFSCACLGQLAGHTRKRKAEEAWFRGMCLHCSYCSDLANLCICHAKGLMGLHDNLWQCEVVDAGSRSCFSVLSGKSSKLRCLSLATPATSTSFGPPGQFLVVASRDSAVWTSLHTRFVTVWSFQLCERAGEIMTFALKMKNSLLPGRARIEKEAIREALWLCLPPLIVYCPSSTIQIRNDWKPVAPPPTFHWTCFAHYEKSWRAHKPTISQNDRWCSNGLQSFRSNETICSKFCYFHITIYSLLRQINQ